jgi:Transposase
VRLTSCWARAKVPEVAKQLEIGEATYHRWQAQYGGLKADDARCLKDLAMVGPART